MKKSRFDYMTMLVSLMVSVICVTFINQMQRKPEKVEATEGTKTTEVPAYGTDYFMNVVELGTWEVPSDFEPIDCNLDKDVQEFAFYMAEASNIDFNFLMSVMYVESGYDSKCISSTSDYGLMQINKCNHAELSSKLGITDFLDPYQSIIAGTYVFRNLFDKYDDTSMVLMAYNMGEGGASRLWKQGIYSSRYSNKVLKKMKEMGE